MILQSIRIASLISGIVVLVSSHSLFGVEQNKVNEQSTVSEQRLVVDSPNILFLLADDLGYGDLGCTGHPYAKTPAIDQLASEGTMFRTFYTAGSTCVPSRVGFMTGRFPQTFSKEVAIGGNIDSPTVTEILKRRGYRTGHFGKWGLGEKQESGTFGVDEIQVLRGDPENVSGRDSVITDATIDFIRRNKHEPFYVNVWFHTPHHPVIPHMSYVDRFADVVFRRSDFQNPDFMSYLDIVENKYGDCSEGMRNYLGDVSQLDDQVSRILKAIDEEGLRQSTIIVFSSDNGPARIKSEGARKWDKGEDDGVDPRVQLGVRSEKSFLGSAGPFRGRKHSLHDGGIRAPWIVRWPGRVAEGKIDEASVITAVDWLPTLASITGARLDGRSVEGNDFDGEDVSQMWFGKKTERERDIFWANGGPESPRLAMRRGSWKYCVFKDGSKSLYDLSKDPSESMDVSSENPSTVAKLDRAMQDWLKGLDPDSYARQLQPGKFRASGVSMSPSKQPLSYRWGMIMAAIISVLVGLSGIVYRLSRSAKG